MKKVILVFICTALVLIAGVGCKSKKLADKSGMYPIDNSSGYDFYHLASDASAAHEYEKACFYYKKFTEEPEALESPENLSVAYNNWAAALGKLSKETNNKKYQKEAFEKIEKAVQLDSTKFRYYMNWGIALSEYGRAKNDNKKILTQSIEKYRKSAELNPDYNKTYQELASNLLYLGRLKKDKPLITESIQKFSLVVDRDSSFYNNYGIALLTLADLNKTTTQNKEQIEEAFFKSCDFGCVEAFSGLAALYAKTGDTDEALKWLERYFRKGRKLTKKEIKDDFKDIRKDKRFKELIKKYNK